MNILGLAFNVSVASVAAVTLIVVSLVAIGLSFAPKFAQRIVYAAAVALGVIIMLIAGFGVPFWAAVLVVVGILLTGLGCYITGRCHEKHSSPSVRI
ncbi:MAG: hypothetical protein LBU20_00090 [Candidatus Nomurabacteria bacterium]|jgi:hypothetical protein|nr:hypothetical protein [Candidatus Nomurabacteria bacterium]